MIKDLDVGYRISSTFLLINSTNSCTECNELKEKEDRLKYCFALFFTHPSDCRSFFSEPKVRAR